jgi:hypothetical protein
MAGLGRPSTSPGCAIGSLVRMILFLQSLKLEVTVFS